VFPNFSHELSYRFSRGIFGGLVGLGEGHPVP
jgi:hypothetical protein